MKKDMDELDITILELYLSSSEISFVTYVTDLTMSSIHNSPIKNISLVGLGFSLVGLLYCLNQRYQLDKQENENRDSNQLKKTLIKK